MKKYFFTGLVTLLPFTLTLIIVIFVINFLTKPFQGTVESVLNYYGALNQPFFFFSGKQILHFGSKVLILAALFVITLFIGFLGRLVFLNTVFVYGDYILHRIPLINKIYKAAQEVVKTLFSSKSLAFSQVVLVPFPNSKAYSLGFITQKQNGTSTQDSLSIFVPGTPNPTMGFMLVYKLEDIIFVDMSVEDALKFVISCGIMFPGFQKGISNLADE